jgi:phage replication initiation protein
MKCEVLIDWLTFSVKQTDPRTVIRDFLGMDPELFQDPGYGLLGYQRILKFSDIIVCYEPRENDYFQDMGVCVSMSGNGCRSFETMSKLSFDGVKDKQGMSSVAFPVLFQLLAADPSANVSRVDIACDDHEGYLDMEEIVRKTQENEINSRMSKRQVVVSYDGRERNGSTVYIGSPSSDFRIRIYDKALEQGQDGHWIRVEMVLRGKNSNAFISEMVNSESVGKLAAQIVNDKFSFIEKDDSNISRCSVCAWWSSFVEELEAVILVSRKVIQHRVDEIDNWLEAQIGPSLAIIIKTLGWPHLFEMAHAAARRLSDKQLSLISDYNSVTATLSF